MSTETKIDDGGPAFPCPMGENWPECDRGMSLRQWYAGIAMQGLCANSGECHRSNKWIADTAVEQADALIARLKQ